MHNAHEVDVGCVDVLLGQVTLRKLLSCAVYVHIHTLLLLWTCVHILFSAALIGFYIIMYIHPSIYDAYVYMYMYIHIHYTHVHM